MALSDSMFSQFLKQSGNLSGSFGGAGTSDIGQVGNFYKTLLGGNRQAIAQAVAPAANAARESADAAKREQAQRGTARTGGAVAQNQQIEDEVRKQIDTLINQAQSGAAAGLKGISDTELSTMMNALGIGTSAAEQDIASRRAASAQMWSSLIGGAADVATGGIAALGARGLGGGGGGGGGAPGPTYTPMPIGGSWSPPPAWGGPVNPYPGAYSSTFPY